MAFELPALPYEINALEPYLSQETLEYHHGKHHATYVAKLNEAVAGTALEDKSLEQIIQTEKGGLFNNAAQIWNHTFYWHCLSPNGGGEPSGAIAKAIDAKFGSFEKFKEAFNASAVGNFGSGWTWLVKTADGSVDILNTDDADTPVAHEGVEALLAVDVWEHAYYIDYRNSRPNYLEAFWKLVNWAFVNSNFAK
jgi:Fe-Mn family superoxide dismutase